MTVPTAPPSPHNTGRRPSAQRNSPRVSPRTSTQSYSSHNSSPRKNQSSPSIQRIIATDMQNLNPPPYNRQHPPPPPPRRASNSSAGGGQQRTRSKSRERTNNPSSSSAMPTQELRRGRSNSDASGGSASRRRRSRSNSFQNEQSSSIMSNNNNRGSNSSRGGSNSDASCGSTRSNSSRRRSRSRSNSFQNDQSSSNISHNKRRSNSSARSRSRSNSRSRRPSHNNNNNETLAAEYNITKREMQKDTLLNSYNNRTGSSEGYNKSYNRTGSTESYHSHGSSHGSRRSSSREEWNRYSSVAVNSITTPLTPMQNEESEDEYSENGWEKQIITGEEERKSIADDNRNCMARVCSTLLCIFPKIEPLPWKTFAVLTVWCGIPPACFILFFSQMGFGEEIYYKVAVEFGHYASSLFILLAVFIFLLYMLDADEWNNRFGATFIDISILLIVCGLVLLVLMIADQFPYGTVCLFAIFQPLWILALKLMCYDHKDTRVFVSWLSGPLFFISVLIASAWTAWVFSNPDNEWNTVARISAAERTGCEPNYENHPDCKLEAGSDETCFYIEKDGNTEELVFPEGCDQSCTDVYSDCLNGFFLWVGPVLISMCTFFLSFFCTFLRTGKSSFHAPSLKHLSVYGSVDDTSPLSHQQQSKLLEGARERDVLNFGVVWIFLLFAMWVTTSLAGTAAGVTAALAALTLASFVASAMFIAVSFSKEERSQNAASVMDRVRTKYGKHLDVARGLFVVTCAPIILIYFGFSIMNQFIRRAGLPFSQPPGDEHDIFTTRTRKQVNTMKSWDRAKVFTYAVYWGIAFMILQVLVANLTVVFLSWMIQQTADLGLAAVTGIMCAVGVCMFLLPPVPGVPVYLTLGIVLPAQGHAIFGWAGSILYSIAIGLLLKLFSSALQQKMIGQNLSHYVKVRQFVGINSTLMKAMRLVLGKDGLSIPKVAILIGGPDWPTSVLCGIMRLGLFQILLGTTPIVFLIAPTCLTGALLYMASLENGSGNPEFPWAGTVSTITAAITAVVQFGSMIVAAYYLERTANKRAADVEAIPDDIEVKEADEKAAHLKRCYHDVTQWNVMPILPRLLIQTSLVCIVTSCYMVQLFSSSCFTPHSLTDSIDENLDGKVSNIFLPLGWAAVALFCVSIVLIYIFESWGEKKAQRLANGSVISPDDGSDSSIVIGY